VDEFIKQELQSEENIQTLYLLSWGQLTGIMSQRIEALDIFEVISSAKNSLELIRAIKNSSYNVQGQKISLNHYMSQSVINTHIHRQTK
jgi:hypothetical protein